jgi:N6-adenosine-specific RNA methylase IME4
VFNAILADPAWQFDDKGSRVSPEKSTNGYPTMPTDRIAALPVSRYATPGAFLFLWTTWTHILNGDAATVAKGWGFTPKTVIPWFKLSDGKSKAKYKDHPAIVWLTENEVKVQIGMGHYVRNGTEPLILCTRRPGRIPPTRQMAGAIFAEPGALVASRGRHSAKPAVQYDLIETMVDGPYLEMFARGRPREGWRALGDQVERG